MRDIALRRAQNIIAQTMASDLAPLFTPDMKLTFVARSTENPDCYMILTDDELPKIIETIQRHGADQQAMAVRREARRQTVELEKRLAAKEGFTYHEVTDGPPGDRPLMQGLDGDPDLKE